MSTLSERGSGFWQQAKSFFILCTKYCRAYVQTQVDEDMDATSRTARVVCEISLIRLHNVTILIKSF